MPPKRRKLEEGLEEFASEDQDFDPIKTTRQEEE